MAAISELAMSTLVARGVPLRQARVIVLTVERFTVGHVLEEQAPRPGAEALKRFDMDAFAREHPTAPAAISEYLADGRTVDDLFRDCLDVVGRPFGGPQLDLDVDLDARWARLRLTMGLPAGAVAGLRRADVRAAQVPARTTAHARRTHP
jgi:hypothetical protein